MPDCYVLFDDVENATGLYNLVKKEIKCTLAPTPREASKCCGVTILHYDEGERKRIRELADENGFKIRSFYTKTTKNDPNRMKFC